MVLSWFADELNRLSLRDDLIGICGRELINVTHGISYTCAREHHLRLLNDSYGLDRIISHYDVHPDVAYHQVINIYAHLKATQLNLSSKYYNSQSVIQLGQWLKANYTEKRYTVPI